MPQDDDEENRREWAVFRFGVIAPLVCGKYDREERQIIRRAILSNSHETPDGQSWQISERTLRNWISEHKKLGLRGLYSKRRKTRGKFSAIDAKTLAAAEKLRRELNSRSIKQILLHLSVQGFDVSKISKTTLNMHLNRLGARKEKDYSDQGAFQRWQKQNINELWQTDCSDGIWLPDPTGLKKDKQTALITFIDDASRLCTHGEFYWNEQLPSLLDCFRKAVTKRGRCEGLYSDNGSIFRSKQWKGVCAELDIGQKFAEKQRPPGKGKVERHFLSIQRGFYKEAQLSGLQTLEELNDFFWEWLDKCYHKEKHSTLKESPLERWQKQEGTIEHVSQERLHEALKLRANRKIDFKTALVRLNGKQFQASKELGGERIQARWHYECTDEIEIWKGGDFVEIAKVFVPLPDIDYSKRPERGSSPKPGMVLESSKNLRLAMVANRKSKGLAPNTKMSDLLTESELVVLVETVLERGLDSRERQKCSEFFRTYCPIRRDFAEGVLIRCVAEKGQYLHINIYLRRIEETQQTMR